MCLYARVVFLCAHERWGLCVKKCQTAENFQASKVDQDCWVKSPHVPTSRKLQRKCSSCIMMEVKFGQAKKSIEDVKQALKRIGEEKRQRTVEGERKKEEERKARPAVGVDCGPELEVISEEDEGTGEDSEMGDGSSWASG